MTAAMVMQLRDEGWFSLDDLLYRLPNFYDLLPDEARPIVASHWVPIVALVLSSRLP